MKKEKESCKGKVERLERKVKKLNKRIDKLMLEKFGSIIAGQITYMMNEESRLQKALDHHDEETLKNWKSVGSKVKKEK